MDILKKGKIGENIFKEYLINVKKENILNICDSWQYDFLTDLNKYEIKTDSNFQRTNKFFLEFMSNGHKSGINTTEANIFVLIGVFPTYFKILEIETNDLKQLIEKNSYETKSAVNKDYKGNTNGINNGYIIPFDDLKKIAINIFNFKK